MTDSSVASRLSVPGGIATPEREQRRPPAGRPNGAVLLSRPPMAGATLLQTALLKLLSLAMVLALTFQSIPLPIRAQVSPLTSFLGLLALPMLLLSQREFVLTPLAKIVVAFVGFLFVHSTFAVFLDVVVWRADGVRLIAWARQLLSLLAGVAVFWVLRSTLRAVSDRRLIRLVLIGAIPPVAIAILNIAWGLLGLAPVGKFIIAVRAVLAPHGFTHPFRASGLSLEPSHFVWYLSVLVFPALFVLLPLTEGLQRAALLCFALLAAAGFLWTFSGSGFLIAAVMGLFVARRLHPARLVGGFIAAVAAAAVTAAVFPNNYLVSSIAEIWRALRSADVSLLNTSAMTVLFSTLGPFLTADTSLTSIGYGLGGTSTHLDSMVPPIARAAILSVTWGGMPSLGIMVGKLFGEAGLIGLLLFLAIWPVAFYQIRCVNAARPDAGDSVPLLGAARWALVGLLAGYCIKHGSFSIPFLWFWLAYIDSRYTSSRTS